MRCSPLIAGVGLVTPLGESAPKTWQALLAGHWIGHHSASALPSPRIRNLARAAVDEAIRDAGWTAIEPGTALVVGTSKGPVETWLEARDGDARLPVGIGRIAEDLAVHLRLDGGPRLTLSAACASGLHALIRAAMLLDGAACRRAIVVAAEASVHPLFLGSFQRLGVLAPPTLGCRPFDRNRAGFFMSDGAAAVCLELPPTDRPAYASVDRFAMGNDSTHLTASDPGGTVLRRLIWQVVHSEPIDLVHAHGTGTVLNDAMELAAIDATVEGGPIVYSHKGALGHTLGAAGLISVVINCLSMRAGVVPGNVCIENPMPTSRVRLFQQPQQRRVARSLAIAAGFGGPMAVVSLA